MVRVHGVEFSRNKPSIAECEYSAVLLQQWMDRHAKDFEIYTEAYVEYHSTKPPVYKNKKKKAEILIRSVHDKIVEIVREYPNPAADPVGGEDNFYVKTLIKIADTGEYKILSIYWPKHIPVNASDITKMVKIPNYLLNAADILLEERATYNQIVEDFEEAKEKINTCEI